MAKDRWGVEVVRREKAAAWEEPHEKGTPFFEEVCERLCYGDKIFNKAVEVREKSYEATDIFC